MYSTPTIFVMRESHAKHIYIKTMTGILCYACANFAQRQDGCSILRSIKPKRITAVKKARTIYQNRSSNIAAEPTTISTPYPSKYLRFYFYNTHQ
ncbi:hypothetical protein BDF20DRAFT_497350 [Mycotypha africana]|uniref:uncharacterized protein n=1 Tax=Mycotypha africana TaxID=64632 RepID=UPI00230153EA|nr:uncharacterized protein BDF20DRAFT_497350 [Mycotypha africana]KAI8979335.1 hypothetical protein BDF20DRAFT_497350 [Mycotypha africana]